MQQLESDVSAKRMKPANAEAYGRERYDIYGGQFLILDPEVYHKRLDKLRASYERDDEAFTAKLEAMGLSMGLNKSGAPVIMRKAAYAFDDVRGIDLQDLRGDFNEPLTFDGKVRNDFMAMAKRRVAAYDAACDYLDRTGQT